MEELIKVKNENNELLVSARELHDGIKDGSERFSKWFDRMCTYGFEENVDFTPYHLVHPKNNQEITDYVLKIECAKEIAMIQRNEKGRIFRKYFIECERKLKEVSTVPMLPESISKEISEFKEDAKFIRSQVSIKKLESTQYVKMIKNYLGISNINQDKYGYEFIRDMFFSQLNISKFEDIPVNKDNMLLLNECCKSYKKPFEQMSMF
ncbi:MAG: antA/AntB antirepressor family protein [Sarcina sp.]